MKKDLELWSMRHVLIFGAALLTVTAFGCGGDDDDDTATGGTGASAPSGSGGGGGGGTSGTPAGGSGGTPPEGGAGGEGGSEPPPTGPPDGDCPPTDPPYEDPYCFNPACPFSDLPGLAEENRPLGNCCNTVDVHVKESQMSSGETLDLEFALLSNLPKANPNLTNALIRDTGFMLKQDVGGDLTLLRIHDVPRTEDHPKDADGNPEPIETILEIGTGKINCDGSFSFYGANAAAEPAFPEAGTPDDPGRWEATQVPTLYYGAEGEVLNTVAEEDTAAAGLNWAPRWINNGNGLEYEIPTRFIFFEPAASNLESHKSCVGTRTADEAWEHATGTFWTFIPVEPLKSITTDVLMGQTICGLFAKGALQGDCDDAQADWPFPPPGYCDETTGYCWIGNTADDHYAEFWAEVYDGESGCDETGAGDKPCCDPVGEDADLPACNAYIYIGEVVMAAVEITDEPINDPNDANSTTNLCE